MALRATKKTRLDPSKEELSFTRTELKTGIIHFNLFFAQQNSSGTLEKIAMEEKQRNRRASGKEKGGCIGVLDSTRLISQWGDRGRRKIAVDYT